MQFDLLYSSDLGRTMGMARRISQECGIDIRPCPDLREISSGIFAGHTWAECKQLFPLEMEAYRDNIDYVVPGGESKKAYHARTFARLNSLAKLHMGKSIVVVAHGGTLDVAFRHLTGLPVEARSPAKALNAGISRLEIASGGWTLKSWGDVTYLVQDEDLLHQ